MDIYYHTFTSDEPEDRLEDSLERIVDQLNKGKSVNVSLTELKHESTKSKDMKNVTTQVFGYGETLTGEPVLFTGVGQVIFI